MILFWTKQLETGIAEIDFQHKELIDVLNAIHDNLQEHKEDGIPQLVGQFKQLVLKHFEYEEQLMQRIEFPGFEAHKEEHKILYAKVKEFETNLLRYSSLGIVRFLTDWLKHHVAEADGDYLAYAKEKNLLDLKP
jgi:hemerythrin-like metal-binding protein